MNWNTEPLGLQGLSGIIIEYSYRITNWGYDVSPLDISTGKLIDVSAASVVLIH